jgi:uncharacterized OB-fold protein
MKETHLFTIEEFYKYAGERKLMAARCSKCGNLHLPPRPVCAKCLSTILKWTELEKRGKLLTFTVIHVTPSQFQSMAPYTVGIVELKDGLKLPGMVRGIEPEEIEVGMDLEVDFDASMPSQWPRWPRYFFKPP